MKPGYGSYPNAILDPCLFLNLLPIFHLLAGITLRSDASTGSELDKAIKVRQVLLVLR